MSVVIAVKVGNKVLMGGDCQVSYGGNKATLISPNLMKVWEVEGHPNTIMGGVGALRDLNIAYANDEYYDTTRDALGQELNFKFMVNEVVPNVMNLFSEHGRTVNDAGIIRLNDSAFLFAQKDKCYQIDSDGCIMELSYEGECIAIGSGATIAQSAYRALEDIDSISTEEKLKRALVRACEEDLHVNYPIYIRDTENPERLYIFDGEEEMIFGDDEEEGEEA